MDKVITNVPGPKPRRNLFGFLDETGSIHNPQDVFGVGLISMVSLSALRRSIIQYRDQRSYHEEFKFNKINPQNVNLYKGFIDLFFSANNIRFCSVLYDEKKLDINKHFSGNKDRAYNSFCARLIAKSLGPSDYIAILADDINTKKADNFEKQIREKIKKTTRRNALFGICRLESHAVSEIQLVDVLLGSVAFAYKIKLGLINPSRKNGKLKIVKHIQSKLNINFLSQQVNSKMRNGIEFTVEEFFKKKDGAVDSIVN